MEKGTGVSKRKKNLVENNPEVNEAVESAAAEAAEAVEGAEAADGAPEDPDAAAKKMKKYMIFGTLGLVLVMAIILLSLWGCSNKKDGKKPATAAEATKEAEKTEDSKEKEETAESEATATPTPTAAASTDGLTVEITETGSWNDGTSDFTQLQIIIKNNTGSDISGWTVKINVGEGAEVDSSWNANFSIADGVLTVTNLDEDWNKIITNGGQVDIGGIFKNVTGDLTYTVEAGGVVTSGETATNNTSNNDSNNNNNGGGAQAVAANALEVPEPTTDDWLSVDGNKIVDANGTEVWLTGCNWFGYNTGTNTFDGLWACDLNTSLQGIADHGFNLLRVPISAELILQWKNGEAPEANFNQATNSYLVGMDSLEIFDYVVGQCRANGLKIMIDIHCAKTDASGHTVNLWYNDTITTEDYQAALEWMAERYAEDDTIIAYDLKNEPHGKPYEENKAIWNDSTDANNWKYVAEQTAAKILAKNPNVLIMVEGTEIYPVDIKTNSDYSSTDDDDYYFNWWGGNLRGVADYPVDLGKYQNKLVYSPHDYGPTVYEQPWFEGDYDYDSLMEDCWHDNWFYIYEDKIAPLLIGEWGGYMTEPNITWMTHMRTLITKYKLNHTFWCFNANSGDTGGLVLDDFITWDEEKYEFVKEALWQQDGKFVGLDHEIPLGTAGNGITLSEVD